MAKSEHKAQTIEWQVCEDESEWQIVQSQQLRNFEGEGRRRQWAQRGLLRWGAPSLLAIILLTLLAGRWLWGRAQRGVVQIETELEAAVIAEAWSATPTLYASEVERLSLQCSVTMQDGERGVVRQVEIRNLGKDWAVIEVLKQPTVAGRTYRQTLVYRYGDRGWIRTETSSEYWGEARRLETGHFIFHYYALDEQAVTEAAARLDALYPVLTASYYYHSPATGKHTIRVDPEWSAEKASAHTITPQAETVVVPSPAAMPIPVELAPSDVLLQSLLLARFNSFSEEVAIHYKSARWLSLHNGLRLWLIWQQELPLAVWRKPLVQWVFSGSQHAIGQISFTVLEDDFAELEFAHDLFRDYHLWKQATVDLTVPIICWKQAGGEEKITAWRFPPREIPLSDLIYVPTLSDNITPRELIQQPGPATVAVGLATVFEYVAATYGVERVPLLMAAAPKYERAETLIPAVFGLPLEELESGWRAFLQEQYGINP